MKKILVLIGLVAVVVGCAQLDKGYTKVTVPASTNAVSGVIVPEHEELADDPRVTGTISTIAGIPIPWAGTGAMAAGFIYTLYRNIRNKKALVAVVQGVDDARGLLQTPELKSLDDKIRDTLIKHQEINGVLKEVSAVVNEYTGDTVKPKL